MFYFYFLLHPFLKFIFSFPILCLHCFPYAVMQQMHRPQIRSTLSDEMKVLSENYYNLRKAIVEFVKNPIPTSEYYELIDEARTSYALTYAAVTKNSLDWDQTLQVMSRNGSWFNEQFMQFTAWFLMRDIFCYTMNSTIKFCASSSNRTGNFQPHVNCNCLAEPLHIANINNVHFQSLLPTEVTVEITNAQQQLNVTHQVTHLLQCTECGYSTPKESNLKRHRNSHK